MSTEAVAAVMSLSLALCTMGMGAMVITLVFRVLPEREAERIAAERRGAYRYAVDAAEGHGVHGGGVHEPRFRPEGPGGPRGPGGGPFGFGQRPGRDG
ncbi:hypothetical protein [Streptomyces sp. NPDC059247]|uniref:hypothetical protein n=1 Tax=Streptomyces sp. NPDC059247 TaxID=3346790 RepID=UPI0036896DDC